MNGNEKANLCCENFGNYVVVKIMTFFGGEHVDLTPIVKINNLIILLQMLV